MPPDTSSNSGYTPVSLLPHPARVGVSAPEFLNQLRGILGPEWPRIQRELMDDRNTLPEVIRRLTEPGVAPRFSSLVMASAGMPGGTEGGAPLGMVAYLRQQCKPAPHFLLDDELVHMLENTDIAPDVPMSLFNLPFARQYIELGRKRDLQTTIPNVESGDHVLEGAYIERGHHVEGEFLYIVMTGSPVGKNGPEDDATLSVALPLVQAGAPDDRPIAEVIHFAQQRAVAEALQAGLRIQPDGWVAQTVKAMLTLVKALLYIGLPGTRRQMHPERTEAMKSVAGLKSPAKKAKAQRRVERIYDYIQISAQPEHVAPAETGLPGERTVKSHWRRGHYRMQAHGAQMLLRKLIFIQPVLVSAQHAGGEPAPAATYRVS